MKYIIEQFVKAKKSGEIAGQKVRITVKYMKEKRRKKWESKFDWLESDLDRLMATVKSTLRTFKTTACQWYLLAVMWLVCIQVWMQRRFPYWYTTQ